MGFWLINCSIGSLAEVAVEAGVRNVTVKRAVVAGTTNGFRIKSYGRPSNGFVDGVSFRHAIMRNVENPIIIDQHYCPSEENCPKDVRENQHTDELKTN